MNYDLRDRYLHLFKLAEVDVIDLETAYMLNIFKTEGTLGYGIGSRDGYGISLHDGEEQKIVYHTE